jgi:hypothetical protein
MSSERRYSDEEVSEILDRATEAQTTRASLSSGATGLTLTELHEIAREVGIPDDVITRAAHSLDHPTARPTPPAKWLGQTIGVGRTVHFPRPLTDQEWHRLVVDLRETFDAKGKIREEGAFRQWSNSNLQALLEPTESGEQLRLVTRKGNAMMYQGMGATMMAIAAATGMAGFFAGAFDPQSFMTLALVGAGAFMGSRLTVPQWARTRARQFEEVIARVTASIAEK